MTTAKASTVDMLVQRLDTMSKQRKKIAIQFLAEEGLTEDDLRTKSDKAMAVPDLNLNAIIFAVDY